jgi:hypothetical protein
MAKLFGRILAVSLVATAGTAHGQSAELRAKLGGLRPTAEAPVGIDTRYLDGTPAAFILYDREPPENCKGRRKTAVAYYGPKEWNRRNVVYSLCDGKLRMIYASRVTVSQLRQVIQTGAFEWGDGDSPQPLPNLNVSTIVEASDVSGSDVAAVWSAPSAPVAVPATAAATANTKLRDAIIASFAAASYFDMYRSFNRLSVAGDTLTADFVGGAQVYRFAVDPASKCSRLANGAERCRYRFKVANSVTLLGLATPGFSSDWISRTDDFVHSQAGMRSTKLTGDFSNALRSASSGSGDRNPIKQAPDKTLTDYVIDFHM